MKRGRPGEADRFFTWAVVGRGDDWDLHAHLGRSFAQKEIADEERARGFGPQADEHEAASREEFHKAFAIDAKHAAETVEKMTSLDLTEFLREEENK